LHGLLENPGRLSGRDTRNPQQQEKAQQNEGSLSDPVMFAFFL